MISTTHKKNKWTKKKHTRKNSDEIYTPCFIHLHSQLIYDQGTKNLWVWKEQFQ